MVIVTLEDPERSQKVVSTCDAAFVALHEKNGTRSYGMGSTNIVEMMKATATMSGTLLNDMIESNGGDPAFRSAIKSAFINMFEHAIEGELSGKVIVKDIVKKE